MVFPRHYLQSFDKCFTSQRNFGKYCLPFYNLFYTSMPTGVFKYQNYPFQCVKFFNFSTHCSVTKIVNGTFILMRKQFPFGKRCGLLIIPFKNKIFYCVKWVFEYHCTEPPLADASDVSKGYASTHGFLYFQITKLKSLF